VLPDSSGIEREIIVLPPPLPDTRKPELMIDGGTSAGLLLLLLLCLRSVPALDQPEAFNCCTEAPDRAQPPRHELSKS
jgi:hypothetical protein